MPPRPQRRGATGAAVEQLGARALPSAGAVGALVRVRVRVRGRGRVRVRVRGKVRGRVLLQQLGDLVDGAKG